MTQNPTDLALTITQSPVTARVYAERLLRLAGWRVQFAIIGESHFVALQHADQRMVEVLACMPGAAATAAHHHLFVDGCPHHLDWPGYCVDVWFNDHPEPSPPADDGLTYVFPGGGAVIPETRVQWRVDAHSLIWWTLHIYPQVHQTTYVYSRSTFDLFNEKRNTLWKI